MATLIQKAIDGYNNIDLRTKDFLLTRSVIPVIIIISSYLYFCLKAGPRYMQGRPAFELKKTILLYNVCQVLLSAYMAYHGTILFFKINWICEPLNYTDNPINNEMLQLCWLYVVAKFTELLDTVFFVLRKKFNHLSFLHMFHHTIMPTGSWICLRYIATGHGVVFGLFNSYVHVVMYSYYLIANLGPEYRKYLWWKEYVTIMQLVQFGLVFLHNLIPLFTSCSYPKYLHVLLILFACIFSFMFGNFYINTYVRKPKKEDIKNK